MTHAVIHPWWMTSIEGYRVLDFIWGQLSVRTVEDRVVPEACSNSMPTVPTFPGAGVSLLCWHWNELERVPVEEVNLPMQPRHWRHVVETQDISMWDWGTRAKCPWGSAGRKGTAEWRPDRLWSHMKNLPFPGGDERKTLKNKSERFRHMTVILFCQG